MTDTTTNTCDCGRPAIHLPVDKAFCSACLVDQGGANKINTDELRTLLGDPGHSRDFYASVLRALSEPWRIDGMVGRPTYNDRRDSMLAEAAKKPVVRVEQFDAFTGVETGDPWVEPDEDGDCLCVAARYVLRRSDAVGVQIPELTEPADALRVLRKIANWIERDFISRGPLARRLDEPPF